MSSPALDMQALSGLRSHFSQALKEFAASSTTTFRVLRSVPSTCPPSSSSAVQTLHVLDSSFNPPSKAHSSLVKAALGAASPPTSPGTTPRVLFLLATVNADKKPKPADFEDRLVMMTLMAEELRASFVHSSTSPTAASTAQVPTLPPPVIDIGITKEPYFTDKAKSIDASGMYGTEIEQIHLTGFDTLIRIFTPKYYPDHDPPLSALAPFLTRHRIRATVRVDKDTTSANLKDTTTDGLDTVDGQKAYLEMIADGGLEHDGLQRAWASKVELVVDDTGEAAGVSSTRIRDAARHGRWDEVQGLVGEGVQAWIRERGLYRD